MKSDIEIAREVTLRPIAEIAAKLGLSEDEIELYGKYKAKVTRKAEGKKGKLILVTAINPTPLGEGKTTVSIGLADAFTLMGKKSCLALREPSLGPVFGIKGGATGGGYSQVLPMEDINLHFTGDLHAITAANNLLAALIDNHIKFGNELGIKTISFRRAMDMNERSLRKIVLCAKGGADGEPHEGGFDITAASEVMTTLCLSESVTDLKRRLAKIIVGYTEDGKAVTAGDLGAQEAMAILLKDAIKPNLVQTIGGTPAFIHGGPFANIAHGCNSVIATKTALSLSDITVTEAGFGADLGAEKFLDIKCRVAGLKPSAVVLVATVRALKYNGGVDKSELTHEDLAALEKGIVNLGAHIDNLTGVFNVPLVVSINKFRTDSDAEIAFVKKYCAERNVKAVVNECFAKGGEGALALAEEVLNAAEKQYELRHAYEMTDPLKVKIEKVAKRIYGAAEVTFSDLAAAKLALAEEQGFGSFPVCIAKTQYSLSPDQKALGRPTGFTFPVTDVTVRGGAGFVVVECGSVMLMPGLPKVPNAYKMTIDEDGVIDGLS
ncbi:MAG: formate--tetrahydrofolate ligase [Clostridia bacterium]|nr:formate--tetrahydrofolate ligase [Clostridia bacterium]